MCGNAVDVEPRSAKGSQMIAVDRVPVGRVVVHISNHNEGQWVVWAASVYETCGANHSAVRRHISASGTPLGPVDRSWYIHGSILNSRVDDSSHIFRHCWVRKKTNWISTRDCNLLNETLRRCMWWMFYGKHTANDNSGIAAFALLPS